LALAVALPPPLFAAKAPPAIAKTSAMTATTPAGLSRKCLRIVENMSSSLS
jgi:hypothetical protein